jgi:UbiD family decarboxylase
VNSFSCLDAEKQLLRISDPVSLEPDLAAAGCALAQLGGPAPALQFDNIHGYTSAQVVMNVHGSWANHALVLGMDKDMSIRDSFSNSHAAISSIRAKLSAWTARPGRRWSSIKTSTCST